MKKKTLLEEVFKEKGMQTTQTGPIEKKKAIMKHSMHGKIAASVLLKLFYQW